MAAENCFHCEAKGIKERVGGNDIMMRYLQRLGKSLMLPVACLPVAAILQGLGYWLDPTAVSYTHLDVYKRQPSFFDNLFLFRLR